MNLWHFYPFLVALASSPLSAISQIQSVQFIGNVTSSNTKNIRDLGFTGTIGKITINTYGDTLTCGNHSEHDRVHQKYCGLLSANSAAYSTGDPTTIQDFNLKDGNSQMFCGYFEEELAMFPESSWGMGITNVIATSETTGVLYFLKNYRPGGVDQMINAGVAIVDVSGPVPTCQRLKDPFWDASKEPWYGEHSVAVGKLNEHIYLYGPANATKFYDGIFVARVLRGQELIKEAYEYWNGTHWSDERIINPSETEAVLSSGFTQGTVTWIPHLNKYLYLYTNFEWVRGCTADHPQGPWGDPFDVYQVQGLSYAYAPVAQTRYDTTGKTLVVSYTAYSNIIQAIKLTFD